MIKARQEYICNKDKSYIYAKQTTCQKVGNTMSQAIGKLYNSKQLSEYCLVKTGGEAIGKVKQIPSNTSLESLQKTLTNTEIAWFACRMINTDLKNIARATKTLKKGSQKKIQDLSNVKEIVL